MRWNLSSNRVNGNDRRSPRKNFTEEDREERLVNFDGQKSDGGILFARVWNRDSCNRRLVPLSADPNRANPLPSLTRTGRNHCEQSSYSQRSPGGSCLLSFYCRHFGCVATRVSVRGDRWRTYSPSILWNWWKIFRKGGQWFREK